MLGSWVLSAMLSQPLHGRTVAFACSARWLQDVGLGVPDPRPQLPDEGLVIVAPANGVEVRIILDHLGVEVSAGDREAKRLHRAVGVAAAPGLFLGVELVPAQPRKLAAQGQMAG